MAKEKANKTNDAGATVMDAPAKFSLPNKKVKVIPVKRKGWLPEKHEASFLYKHATHRIGIARKSVGGAYVNPLTPEEAEFLENHPGMSLKPGDLSIHKTDNNFWKMIFKPVVLGKTEITLDLSDPMDYITRSVLLTNRNFIADGAAEARKKASYKYMIVDVDYADGKKSSAANLVADAYSAYTKIREDKTSLADILFLLQNHRVPADAKLEWLQGQAGEEVAKNPKRFLDVINDVNLQTRILITKALTYSAMQKDGTIYRTMGGDLMGSDLASTMAFLKNDSNNDHRILIETMVNRAEGRD